MHGHAVEARLYAEDPENNHLPTSGILHRFRFPTRPGLRVDTGYLDGSTVTTNYDAMLAKVIAWAPTRTEAVARLASALAVAEIHGVVTNRELLVAALRHPEFGRGNTDTGFLERNAADLKRRPTPTPTLELHALAAALVVRAQARRTLPTPPGIPDGWRNVGPAAQTTTFDADGSVITVDFALDEVTLIESSAERVVFEVHGTRLDVHVHRVGEMFHCDSALGNTALRRHPRFPVPQSGVEAGSLLSPLPGTVVAVLVETGDHVELGDELAVVEAMKMQHTIQAPHAGTVTQVVVKVGAQVDAGAVLFVLNADG
jgi:acetyl/propionyl-CoA carboxylase alpha subunit